MKEELLYIDRILWPVTALGPGRRIAVWVSGCGRHCPRCANPELWERRPSQAIPVARMGRLLRQMLRERQPDGLTVTGGEPFDQAGALNMLFQEIREELPELLIYTGYREEELRENPEQRTLLEWADVLIDGPYLDGRNVPSAVLRGSENQRILIRNPHVRESYAAYLAQGRQIQNFVYDYRILSVGIHNRAGAEADPGQQ